MDRYGPPSARREVILFASCGVQVTSARLVVGGQKYPIAAITGVASFKLRAPRIAFFGAALLLAVGAFGGLTSSLEGRPSTALLLFGALTVLCFWRALASKDLYGVTIAIDGVRVRVLSSTDAAFVEQVLAALRRAVPSPG